MRKERREEKTSCFLERHTKEEEEEEVPRKRECPSKATTQTSYVTNNILLLFKFFYIYIYINV